MTNRYVIVNLASGATLGTYRADSSDDALDAMAKDAGYQDCGHMIEQVGYDPDVVTYQVADDSADIETGTGYGLTGPANDPRAFASEELKA